MPRPPRTVSANFTPGSAASRARVICHGNVAPGMALVGSPVAELTEPTVVAEPTARTATGPPAAIAVASCPSGAPVVVNSSGAPQASPVSLAAQDGAGNARMAQASRREANRSIPPYPVSVLATAGKLTDGRDAGVRPLLRYHAASPPTATMASAPSRLTAPASQRFRPLPDPVWRGSRRRFLSR